MSSLHFKSVKAESFPCFLPQENLKDDLAEKDTVPDSEVLERVKALSIFCHLVLEKIHLGWADHKVLDYRLNKTHLQLRAC